MYGWLASEQLSGLSTFDTMVKAPASEQLAFLAESPSCLTHELTAKLVLPALFSATTMAVPATASRNTTTTTTRPRSRPRRLFGAGGGGVGIPVSPSIGGGAGGGGRG